MALKAYSFSDNEPINEGVHDRSLLEKEKLLSCEFVANNPCKLEPHICPVCGSNEIESFSVIYGASYFRCASCWSLFTPVTDEITSGYREYAPLINLRKSKKYQQAVSQKRTSVWQEQLFWIKYRCARYLEPLENLTVTEVGGRYEGFSEMLRGSCTSYNCYRFASVTQGTSDIIVYFGEIIHEPNPVEALLAMRPHINEGGLLFLSTRVSTGFDILTLKGKVDSIYPYDCSVIPSVEALELMLRKSGYELLEISTPGVLDMHYVTENSSKLGHDDLFTRYLVEKTDESVKSEFQRLLQKSMISSHAQLVAKVNNG